ncbi:hypothetical protein [Erythrobacter phage vB_EliS-L02]|nr:hypothetical protein [Erythrobacter phage vB_EliS-L02]
MGRKGMNDITRQTADPFQVQADDGYKLGQWVWATTTNHRGEKERWLGCVMHVGSNYIRVESPPEGRHGGNSYARIHFDKLADCVEPAPDAADYIQRCLVNSQSEVNRLLVEINEVTKRLGVVPTQRLADGTGEGGQSLAVLSEQVDTAAYKNALIQAKDETLPDLFERVEEANGRVAKWMKAPILPMQASIKPMKQAVKAIEERVFTVEIYAGLTEDAVKIRDGDPAQTYEKLRVMQRRHYMDEECLVDYQTGGMSIEEISQFDAFIAQDHVMERLLPFPRCCVAFQVRRKEKERSARSIAEAFINLQLAQADKLTFLYVRNGDQLWRIETAIEFDEKLFPDEDDYDPSREMMIEIFTGARSVFPKSEYDAAMEEYERRKEEAERKTAENPKDAWRYRASLNSKYERAEPFNPSSTFYDDACEIVGDAMKRFNRIAVVLQGLLDRSLVLHPHAPIKVWDPVSFESGIELVYDSTTLTYGDPPDFEAFRAKLNESLGPDSIVTGQERVWMKREAARVNEEDRRSYRSGGHRTDYKLYRPYGDPGPGFVSRMDKWMPRARKAKFQWHRDSRNWRSDYGAQVAASITVPADKLLNVSAYKPGDYRQFFLDPRTRAEYFKWAPMLLAAEEYHAGNVTLGKPGRAGSEWE